MTKLGILVAIAAVLFGVALLLPGPTMQMGPAVVSEYTEIETYEEVRVPDLWVPNFYPPHYLSCRRW